jgi:hypothetical protein
MSIIRSSFKLQSQSQWSADHGWKHIYLGIHTETGGSDCSLKELLMMGITMPETC